MSKRGMMVAGALLLMCLAPQAAMAAAESMVTVTLGSQKPLDDFGDVAKSGTMAGFSAGFRVSRWLATGVDFTYFRGAGTKDGTPLSLPQDPGTQRPVDVTLAENWTINELGLYGKAFFFERGHVSPYLRAGAGTYSIRYSQDVSTASAGTTLGGNESASKPGVNAGAGFRYRVVGGTSLGFEVLYHHIYAKRTTVNLWTTGFTVGFGPTGN